MRCVIRDENNAAWLLYERPIQVFEARAARDVIPVLESVERAAYEGHWAIGFVSYEASHAFDRALVTKPAGDIPLATFGIYERAERVSLEDLRCGTWELGDVRLEIERGDYLRAVETIRELIAQGIVYQVNYTARFRGRFAGNPLALFADLFASQPTQFAAFIEYGRHAVCSVSPELFFSLNGGVLVSRPMKGTIQRGRDLEEDESQVLRLARSEKDLAENAMIADMVRNDLGKVARPGTVSVSRAFAIEKYPTVFQMVTEVQCHSSATLPEIFSALFPPASITGAPKASAMRHIARLELSPRGVYTGAVGVVFPGADRRARFSVAIRTAVVDIEPGELEYGSGGGIVYDSDAGKEYEELCLKAMLLTEPRPPFRLVETMRVNQGGHIVFLDRHLRRLERSARYFGFSVDINQILKEARKRARACEEDSAILRLLVSKDGETEWELRAWEKWPLGDRARLRLAVSPIDSRNVFLRHKTTRREVYDNALSSAGAEGAFDDVVLFNERGEVTETTRANIFVARGGRLVTPPVECGLLPGILREVLLEEGSAVEGVITIDELRKASEIYIGNSVRGLLRADLT
jgi:para-aminobenzoate synthetase/4-amino-4-deoxychorismate lyase